MALALDGIKVLELTRGRARCILYHDVGGHGR